MYLRAGKVSDWKQINFRNVDSMLSVQFIYDLYDQYNSTINWFRFKNICLYYQDNKLWSYTPNDEWEKAISNISKQFRNPNKFSNPDIIKNCYGYYHRKEKLLEKFLRNSKKINLKELNKEALYDLLFNWYQITINQIYFINLAPVELGLQRAISDLNVEKLLSSEETSILYSLEDNTAVIKEEYAFLNSVLNAHNKSAKQIISKHLKEFGYVTIGYGSKPLDESVLQARYDNMISLGKEAIQKRINEIESYPNLIKEKKETVNKKLNNKQLTELFDLASKLGIMRDRKKALLGKSVQYRNLIIDEIINKTQLSNEEIKYYIMDDFNNLLIHNKRLGLDEIETRKQGIYISSVSSLSSGVHAREDYYSSVKTEIEDKGILNTRKGICASSGKVTGRARICLTFEESNNLQKDEILVTYGTDFDFMNAIVKSKAIITEEGGILSHASVISRELKKPCIIAFKGITKIIKNGDLIEIDADNGTVKIIEDEKLNNQVRNLNIKGLYEINAKVDSTEIGNKAYNLSQLHDLKFNIPESYFLGVSFFKTILEKQNLLDEYIKYTENLKKNKNNIYELIDKVDIPKDELQKLLNFDKHTYAVRSSSPNEDGEAKSFAGQFITELFCDSIDFTIKSIKKCWKSLLGVNLETYQESELSSQFGGIIIQRMITADYSGVLFTKNPVSNNKDCMVIECCKGVASKLVDNKVIPDRYFIDQKELVIIDEISKNDIPRDKILELAKIGKKLEEHYGCDVDIEWACENDKIYLIQCRPITT